MKFKTKPYGHQIAALKKSGERAAFGYAMEQGTGKSKVAVDEVAGLYMKGQVELMIVIAPNVVHRKWVTNEVAAHLHDDIERRAVFWTPERTKKRERLIAGLFEPGHHLRIFTVNCEAVQQHEVEDLLRNLMMAFRTILIVDESQRFKNPDAVRTKVLMGLRRYTRFRRILSGTMITQSPFDAFAQFNFLDPDILKQTSFSAFRAEYAVMHTQHSGLMKALIERGVMSKKKAAHSQIVVRDRDGMPRYRNLQKLQKLIEPHIYRVMKKDCLDLPAKIYDTIEFELTPKQRQAYDTMRKKLRADLAEYTAKKGQKKGSDQLILTNVISSMSKLQQITSGYIIDDNGAVRRMFNGLKNPRMDAMNEFMQDTEGSVIIWCKFHEEVDDVAEVIEKVYKEKAIKFDGRMSPRDRDAAIDAFESKKIRFFIGHPKAGGVGLTLVAAETMFYYTNSFSLEDRLQSEDRAHRIGQKKNLRIFDVQALDTIDQKIVASLRMKKDVAHQIYGDHFVEEWL